MLTLLATTMLCTVVTVWGLAMSRGWSWRKNRKQNVIAVTLSCPASVTGDQWRPLRPPGTSVHHCTPSASNATSGTQQTPVRSPHRWQTDCLPSAVNSLHQLRLASASHVAANSGAGFVSLSACHNV